jgi:limonene-1,2-epoxide hydrolase
MIPRFVELFDDVDFFLLAGRSTLMEQGALEVELPACVERGVSVVIGAVGADVFPVRLDVAWLASEACSFSTGAVFDISGGRATY